MSTLLIQAIIMVVTTPVTRLRLRTMVDTVTPTGPMVHTTADTTDRPITGTRLITAAGQS